jgi:hypothetical protein
MAHKSAKALVNRNLFTKNNQEQGCEDKAPTNLMKEIVPHPDWLDIACVEEEDKQARRKNKKHFRRN